MFSKIQFSASLLLMLSAVGAANAKVTCRIQSLPALAAYIDRYAISSLDPGQSTYSTTSGIALAWNDLQAEARLASDYLKTNGMNTTASIKLGQAEDNAAIYALERGLFPKRDPDEGELKAFYAETSGTYSQPAYSRFEYYFLERKPEQTSAALALLFNRLKDNKEADGDFFHIDPSHVPQNVTSGIVTVLRGKINPQIEEEVFTLPLNTPTLFSGEHGWYIFSVQERQLTSETLTYQNARQKLRQDFIKHRRQQSEAEVSARIRKKFPISWETTSTLSHAEFVSPDRKVGRIGGRDIFVRDVTGFSRENNINVMPGSKDWQNQLTLYMTRQGAIELARSEGFTSSCLYNLSRDLAYYKSLAQIEISERVERETILPHESDLEKEYARLQDKLQTGEQYGVVDFWTTAPTSAQYKAKDEFHLKREAIAKRFAEFRDVLSESGYQISSIPSLDRKYGPFVIQDLGVGPQGPRGHLVDMAVESLEVGKFSNVVSDAYAFHFYLLTAKVPSRPLSYDAAKPKLMRQMIAQRRETKYMEILSQIEDKQVPLPGGAETLLDTEVRKEILDKAAATKSISD